MNLLVEETALHAALKPVVRGGEGDVAVSLSIDRLSDDCALQRYYFLLPRTSGKAGGKRFALNVLSAFGPYSSRCEASFIRTSACALGLLEPDAISRRYAADV